MTEFDKRVINLKSFGSDLVTDYFGFLESTKIEQDSMRFIYKILGGEVSSKSGHQLDRIQTIAGISIEKIQFRFEMFKHHAKFFPLSSAPEEYDALSIAVICDEYTPHINERLQKDFEEGDDIEDEEELPHRDDGIDELLSGRASYIWEAAGDIELHGVPEDLEFPEPEAVFLAHINVMTNLREMEDELDDCPVERLEEIIKKDFPRYKTFLCPHTTIGADTQEWMKRIETSINSILSPPPPPTRPQLRLVPTGPQ